MTRVRIALAILIATALLPAAGVLQDAATNPATFHRGEDQLTAFERHLAPLRETLRGERVVGYLAPTQLDRTAHLYSVRYALAPLKVVDELDQPLVIADGVTDLQVIPSSLRVRRDFGDGLFLLEQAPQ